MDTTDPQITFSGSGLCNYCQWFDNSVGPKLFSKDRPVQFESALEKVRAQGVGKDFDCIIGLSGGADSSYLLALAVENGLRPLAVHVDAGWNSELAVSNIERLVDTLNVDLETVVIDWEEMRDLQLAFLRSGVPNQDIPQDHAFFSSLYRVAEKEGIRVVLNGNNMATESILPTSWGYSSSDGLHVRKIHEIFGESPLKSFPIASVFDFKVKWPHILQISSLRLLDLVDYSRENALEELGAIGWREYGAKHTESVWTKFFQSCFLPFRFGYDKRKAHLSSEINSGIIGRTDALNKLAEPLCSDSDLETQVKSIANKLGVSVDQIEFFFEIPLHHHAEYGDARRIGEAIDKMGSLLRHLRGRLRV